MTKPKEYKKPIIQIFAKIKYFYKCFQIVMTSRQDFWDTITIVITLDFLHKDFNTTIISLLKIGDKIINQIQTILQSKKAKNISKKAIKRGIGYLAITFKDNSTFKKKANTYKEYYNCHKLEHFRKNCLLFNRWLN